MRLLSYNIHKGVGGADQRYRMERILDVIEHENPDLILLQEVDRNVKRSKFDDQPQQLRERFRFRDDLYQLNVPRDAGGYGNMLGSRWEFLSHHQITLRFENKKIRGAQIAVIATPEGPVKIVNWHLGLAERTRQWQVAHVLEHRLFREHPDVPTLIAGDFNDWRNTLAKGAFAQHGFSQVTMPASRFRSFPAYLPIGSLDKAFCRGKIEIHEARIVRTRLARQASDHLPLVIDFHLLKQANLISGTAVDQGTKESVDADVPDSHGEDLVGMHPDRRRTPTTSSQPFTST